MGRPDSGFWILETGAVEGGRAARILYSAFCILPATCACDAYAWEQRWHMSGCWILDSGNWAGGVAGDELLKWLPSGGCGMGKRCSVLSVSGELFGETSRRDTSPRLSLRRPSKRYEGGGEDICWLSPVSGICGVRPVATPPCVWRSWRRQLGTGIKGRRSNWCQSSPQDFVTHHVAAISSWGVALGLVAPAEVS